MNYSEIRVDRLYSKIGGFMKSLIQKFIVFSMLLSICSLSLAVAARGGAGRGGAMRGGQVGRDNFQHQGGNINRGNFSHNNINNFHGGNDWHGNWNGGYYGVGGFGAGLGTAAIISAERPYPPVVYPVETVYPDYSQQMYQNQ